MRNSSPRLKFITITEYTLKCSDTRLVTQAHSPSCTQSQRVSGGHPRFLTSQEWIRIHQKGLIMLKEYPRFGVIVSIIPGVISSTPILFVIIIQVARLNINIVLRPTRNIALNASTTDNYDQLPLVD